MWNLLAIEEIADSCRYYQMESTPIPFVILSYGRRLPQGEILLKKIKSTNFAKISYPSLEAAFENRNYLSKFLFRDAEKFANFQQFSGRFSGKEKGYLMSTLNQWTIFEKLANGTFPDRVLIMEDDVFVVPDFIRKLVAIQVQLENLAHPWEVIRKSIEFFVMIFCKGGVFGDLS
jgi:hypothetical protein